MYNSKEKYEKYLIRVKEMRNEHPKFNNIIRNDDMFRKRSECSRRVNVRHGCTFMVEVFVPHGNNNN